MGQPLLSEKTIALYVNNVFFLQNLHYLVSKSLLFKQGNCLDTHFIYKVQFNHYFLVRIVQFLATTSLKNSKNAMFFR